MLVLVLCILGLMSPMLCGGQMSRLAMVRFRGWWIVVVALLSQILIIEVVPGTTPTVLDVVHVATYVAAGVFIALNWRTPGLLVIAVGGALNGVTIALNGGQLPASRGALEMAGIEIAKGDFVNSGVLNDPVLPFLGDIFVWPEPLPFANVFSIGDVLIVLGAIYGAHKISGSRLVRHRWIPPDERTPLLRAVEPQPDAPAPPYAAASVTGSVARNA